jgi:hypothetical protein
MANKRSLPALPFVSAMAGAMLLSGCSDPNGGWTASGPTKTCVDAQGRRLMDQSCARVGGGGGHWYYFGGGGRIPPVGERVSGGSSVPLTGVGYSESHVARGGFGRIGAAFGGHGGGE